MNKEIGNGLVTSTMIGLSALGIGTATYLIMPTVMFGIAGMAGALVVGMSSLAVLPYKRRKLKVIEATTKNVNIKKKQFRLNVAELSHKLKEHMANKFSEELKESVASIQTTISPYTFYIRAEDKKLEEQQAKLKETKESIQKIKGIIEQLTIPSSAENVKNEEKQK